MQTKNDNRILEEAKIPTKIWKGKQIKWNQKLFNVDFIIYIFCIYSFTSTMKKNFKMYALVYMVQFLDKSCE